MCIGVVFQCRGLFDLEVESAEGPTLFLSISRVFKEKGRVLGCSEFNGDMTGTRGL